MAGESTRPGLTFLLTRDRQVSRARAMIDASHGSQQRFDRGSPLEGPPHVPIYRHAWDISELLDRLHRRGLYSVLLLETELGPYRFVYDRNRGELWYEGRTTSLKSYTANELQCCDDDDCADPELTADPGALEDEPIVEAGDIVRAVFRLLHPGKVPPSTHTPGPEGDIRGFDLDLAAIRRSLSSRSH